jgi:hypothetical protein
MANLLSPSKHDIDVMFCEIDSNEGPDGNDVITRTGRAWGKCKCGKSVMLKFGEEK